MTADNEKLVREFCAAWESRDVDAILSFFAPDAVYHNIPVAPAVGHDAIRGLLQMFVPPSEKIEFEIRNLVSDGDVVLTERVDKFLMNGKQVELPVMGAFELKDGKIAAWRDYFDMQTWINQSS